MVTPPVPSRRQAPGAGEAGEVQMAKALVLGGATGLLGQALTRVLTERGWQVETLGRADGNLLEMPFLEERLAKADADAALALLREGGEPGAYILGEIVPGEGGVELW